MRAWFPFLAVLALVLSVGPAAAKEAADPVAAFAERLGRPADASAARELAADLRRGPTAALVAFVDALARCGGVVAYDQLVRLAEHDDEAVRVAALRRLVRLGLQGSAGREVLRRRLPASKGTERTLVLHAFGRLGSGDDVDGLVRAALEGEKAAFGALRRRTGHRLTDNASRWRSWWRVAGPRLRADLRRDLEGLDAEPKSATADQRRARVLARAWVDPALVATFATRWLAGWHAHRNRHAGLLAARLGLVELADALGRRQAATKPSSLAHAPLTDALAALGIRAEAAAEAEREPRVQSPSATRR